MQAGILWLKIKKTNTTKQTNKGQRQTMMHQMLGKKRMLQRGDLWKKNLVQPWSKQC